MSGVNQPRSATRGFTLLEVVLVMGLVAAFAALLWRGGNPPTENLAIESAQVMLAGTIGQARRQALLSGQRARLVVQVDTAPAEASRFRRQLSVQVEDAPNVWRTTSAIVLPDGVYVLPPRGRAELGLLAEADVWPTSSLLANAAVMTTVVGAGQVRGENCAFATTGSTGDNGEVWIALGRPRVAEEVKEGESPVEILNHSAVRGLRVNAYGLVTFLDYDVP